jgi:hypothetical protein
MTKQQVATRAAAILSVPDDAEHSIAAVRIVDALRWIAPSADWDDAEQIAEFYAAVQGVIDTLLTCKEPPHV